MSDARGRVLIVEDDQSVALSLRALLERHAYRVTRARDAEEALAALSADAFHGVVQDMNFGSGTDGRDGVELLRAIKSARPELPVVLITAWGSIDLAVEGMRLGAADFLTKPWDNQTLLKSLSTAMTLATPAATEALRSDIDRLGDFSHVLGDSPAICKVLATVARVAPTDASVLITGESGTGKEVIADALHRNSPRRNGPLVKVNLGGVPQTLFEAEMFGHVRGAFTDAKSERDGHFSTADGGTLFLDEVGELEKASQVKLLRVLQDQRFQRLGESRERKVDVRIIAATNADLPALISGGRFREDLYYRLHVVNLALPPLRDRVGDVGALAEHFIARAAERYQRGTPSLSSGGLRWLESQRWPGNVRELKQAVERAVLLTDSDCIEPTDFTAHEDAEDDAGNSRDIGDRTLAEVEERLVRQQLDRHGNNLSRAAEALGISRAALYRRMEKYGLRD